VVDGDIPLASSCIEWVPFNFQTSDSEKGGNKTAGDDHPFIDSDKLALKYTVELLRSP
jgi:hypothetical protein